MSRKNPFVMPILKWVGGKRQLLDSINPLIPECSTYYEPFIGGGAVLFGRQPNKAVINDSNEELINVYRMIKEEPEALIAALSAHKEQNCEEYYYTVRAWDRDKETYQTRTNVERAARIIYLNRPATTACSASTAPASSILRGADIRIRISRTRRLSMR